MYLVLIGTLPDTQTEKNTHLICTVIRDLKVYALKWKHRNKVRIKIRVCQLEESVRNGKKTVAKQLLYHIWVQLPAFPWLKLTKS